MAVNTVPSWVQVGKIHADAAGQLRVIGRNHIALYLIGYFVECNAKALCCANKRQPPRAGSAGHNLVGLIELGGTRVSDLRADWRHFAQHRQVGLRYEESIPADIAQPQVYDAGHTLGSHLARLSWRRLRRTHR